MWKYVGLGLWWLFLAVATMIVETAVADIPLWVMVIVAMVLATAALPLMFWREGRRAVAPTNGWDVAALIMTADTLTQAEAIHSRFMSNAVRAGDINAEAAIAIRRNRESGMEAGFAADLKAAQDEQPLFARYGHDEYMTARARLEERFPP